jgi:hypothetical protein
MAEQGSQMTASTVIKSALQRKAFCRETVGDYGLAVDGFMQAMAQKVINS